MQSLLFPLLIVAVGLMMFFSMRKQKRTAQAQKDLQSSIGVGDRVMTTSGLYGTVENTSEETIDIEIAPGVVTTWLRAAVRQKVEEDGGDEAGSDSMDYTADDARTHEEITEADYDAVAEVPDVAEPLEQTKKIKN